MALAVQANLVQLKVADGKRRGIAPTNHDIQTPAPGAVLRYRETLIDRRVIQAYGDLELRLRLHEVWGRFCLMGWLFSKEADDGSCDLSDLSDDATMRCAATMAIKHDELHAMLWRLRFEQRKRHDADLSQSPAFSRDDRLAGTIPLKLFGKTVDDCTEEEILLGACQHVGMLATLRWTMRNDVVWNDETLMHVADQPFMSSRS